MSEGDFQILEKLNEMDRRLTAVEQRIIEGAVIQKEIVRMLGKIDERLRRVEHGDAINGGNGAPNG